MNPETRHPSAARMRPGRASLGELLRSRSVQALLLATAALQFTALRAGVARPAPGPFSVAPVTAAVPALARPLAARPVVGGAEQLAASYRSRGYRVPADLASDIHDAAVDNGIDPEVAFGLVRTESGFRNAATSRVGAVGLTQLMPATARWLEPGTTRSDLRDQETNLRIGFKYLRQLIDRYDGNTELALLAYNRGPGTVDRVLKRGGDPDNGYADMVLGR